MRSSIPSRVIEIGGASNYISDDSAFCVHNYLNAARRPQLGFSQISLSLKSMRYIYFHCKSSENVEASKLTYDVSWKAPRFTGMNFMADEGKSSLNNKKTFNVH